MSDFLVWRRSADKGFISAEPVKDTANVLCVNLSYTEIYPENTDISGETVILFEPHMKLNGSLLDCLDLHLWCMKHGIETTLGILADSDEIFTDCIENLITMFSERYCYYVSDLNFIKRVKSYQVPTIGKAIIFDYTTFFSVEKLLKHIPTVFISNILESEKSKVENWMLARKSMDSLITLNEIGYSMVGSEKYRQKYLLDALKRNMEYPTYPSQKPHTLVVCPGMDIETLKSSIENGLWGEYVPDLDILNNLKLRNGIVDYIPNMLQYAESVIYFQSPLVYDRKPRVLLESLYLGIPTEYYALKNYYGDGSTMRWVTDSDRECRLYTFDDKVIRFIIGE